MAIKKEGKSDIKPDSDITLILSVRQKEKGNNYIDIIEYWTAH